MQFCGTLILALSIGLVSVANSQEIKKGHRPATIEGKVVAISQETVIESLNGAADILLVKIEKVINGRVPGRYVRVDFVDPVTTTDAQKLQESHEIHLKLLHSLQEGQTWKFRLGPPNGISECVHLIPPPPRPGELSGFEVPPIISVAEAKGNPDINTLTCYMLAQKDIQLVPPRKQ